MYETNKTMMQVADLSDLIVKPPKFKKLPDISQTHRQKSQNKLAILNQ